MSTLRRAIFVACPARTAMRVDPHKPVSAPKGREHARGACLEDFGAVLTVRDLAALLRVDKDSAYKLIHSGALAHIRCGRAIRIPKTAVENMLGISASHRSAEQPLRKPTA